MEYTIIDFKEHHVYVSSQVGIVSIPVPILDNLYVTGDTLDAHIKANLQSIYDEEQKHNLTETTIANAHEIYALVTPNQYFTDRDSEAVKVVRNRFLNLTDWTQASDNSLSDEQKQAWKTYRQALRDMTSQAGFPSTVVFPTPPSPITTRSGTILTNTDGSLIKTNFRYTDGSFINTNFS
jgi:hypothetical protein